MLIKKILPVYATLAVLLLIAFATSASAAWVKFGENDRLVSYYEPTKPDTMGNIIVWVMYDYKMEQVSQRSGRRYYSQKGQQEVDCGGQRSRTVFFTWHAGRMGEGEVVYTGLKALPWEPNSPGSIARDLSLAVCAQK
jgi:hypothetical protein